MRGRVTRVFVAGFVLLGASACGQRPAEVRYGPRPELSGALFLPDDAALPMPGVVLVHGGCFEAGSRRAMTVYAEALARRGVAALAIDYRLNHEGGAYPAAVDDVRCALGWMRAEGREWGIDPERVALLGASAGGYLVGRATLDPGQPDGCATPATPRAVVLLYAVSDWVARARTGMRECEQRFLAPVCDATRPSGCHAASLVALPGLHPAGFLLLHGGRDEDIPIDQSRRLADHLRRAGSDVALEEVGSAGHGFDLDDDAVGRRARDRVLSFLVHRLRAPPPAQLPTQ